MTPAKPPRPTVEPHDLNGGRFRTAGFSDSLTNSRSRRSNPDAKRPTNGGNCYRIKQPTEAAIRWPFDDVAHIVGKWHICRCLTKAARRTFTGVLLDEKFSTMARVKYGDGVSGQSGSLNKNAGGVTYLKNNVKRMRSVGTNPRTANQTEVRNVFAFLTAEWASLTEGQRQAWEDARNDPYFYVSDSFYGVSRKVNSGKSLFIQVNYNLLQSTDGLDTPSVVTTNPSLNEPGDDIGGIAFVADASANSLTLTYTGNLANEVLLVKSTPPVSAGNMRETSVLSKMRDAGNVVNAASPHPIEGKAGVYTGQDGEKVFYQVWGINVTSGKKRPIAAGYTVIVA